MYILIEKFSFYCRQVGFPWVVLLVCTRPTISIVNWRAYLCARPSSTTVQSSMNRCVSHHQMGHGQSYWCFMETATTWCPSNGVERPMINWKSSACKVNLWHWETQCTSWKPKSCVIYNNGYSTIYHHWRVISPRSCDSNSLRQMKNILYTLYILCWMWTSYVHNWFDK